MRATYGTTWSGTSFRRWILLSTTMVRNKARRVDRDDRGHQGAGVWRDPRGGLQLFSRRKAGLRPCAQTAPGAFTYPVKAGRYNGKRSLSPTFFRADIF